jgi:hypothetical protein
MAQPRGEEVQGEISSADASGGVTLSLYTPAGDVRTLTSNEILVISDYLIAWNVAGSVALVANTDAAGKRIFKATVAAAGGVQANLQAPHYCARGVTPVLIASAGQVDVQIHGYIIH